MNSETGKLAGRPAGKQAGRLTGKLALVTGGSRGIGRAVCVRLAEEGCGIVFSYRSGQEEAEKTAELCREAGAENVLAVRADVSSPEDCEMLLKEADNAALQNGTGFYILVNNAGITKDALLIGMKNEDLDAVLDVNLKGSFYMMRGAAKRMLRKRAGRIINISSVAGVLGNAGQVNYAASKAAVIGMTKSLAREVASRGITVNAIAPGMIRTDMTAALPDQAREKLEAGIPLGRAGDPRDVAEAVAFLAGDGGAYITGQVICVDGGMTI